MDSNIKKIDNNGRLVLGKQFAGNHVSVDTSNPNEILIKLVDVIPREERGHVTTLTPDSFATLVDYLENPQEDTPAFLDAQERYKELTSK